jgi:hypothetical protein
MPFSNEKGHLRVVNDKIMPVLLDKAVLLSNK